MTMAKIMLFGGGLQVLSLARGIKRMGNYIVNMGEPKSVGKYSRYVDKFCEVDLKKLTTFYFIDFLLNNRIDVIIPTEDEFAEWLSLNKERIENATSCLCAVVDYSLFCKTINKGTLLSVCEEKGIPHPKTRRIDLSNLGDCISAVGFPALIKPDISNGSRGILKVETESEFRDNVEKIINSYGSCTLQEYICHQRHYYNAMLYRYKDGDYGPSVVTKITRYYPIKGGSSSFCTSIENPRIIEICRNLLDELNWIGFADFDILEKEDGDYRIIEINPRVPASLQAALASGIDFGKIIISDLMEKRKLSMEYNHGKQLRFLGLDIAWFLASGDRFRCKPSWFKFIGKNLYYQEGGIKDPLAMAFSIWSGIKKQLSPSFRKAKSGMN